MKLLNIGCGNVFHPSWINIDIAPSSSHVIQCDIDTGIPFENDFFDACYCSHLLEHISFSKAPAFINEIFRVTKPGGILRVVVPDIEGIVRTYLELLEKVKSGNLHAENDYDWIMLEMYDQTVRTFSGGEMKKYFEKDKIKNKDFILSRVGNEADLFFSKANNGKIFIFNKNSSYRILLKLLQKIRYILAKFMVYAFLGNIGMISFEEGYFRNSGEIHQWMYDSFSLSRLLKTTGFKNVVKCEANESNIEGFLEYGLDTINDKVRKPDSLFMEASKPF